MAVQDCIGQEAVNASMTRPSETQIRDRNVDREAVLEVAEVAGTLRLTNATDLATAAKLPLLPDTQAKRFPFNCV